MRRVKKLRAQTGTYTDRQTGQEKKAYTTIGYLLQKEDGSQMVKIDSIPVEFTGWVYFGDLETQQATNQAGMTNHPEHTNRMPQQAATPPESHPEYDDDIPF